MLQILSKEEVEKIGYGSGVVMITPEQFALVKTKDEYGYTWKLDYVKRLSDKEMEDKGLNCRYRYREHIVDAPADYDSVREISAGFNLDGGEDKNTAPIPDYAKIGDVFLTDKGYLLTVASGGTLIDSVHLEKAKYYHDLKKQRYFGNNFGEEVKLQLGIYADVHVYLNFDIEDYMTAEEQERKEAVER
jgi:hypothetical protein